MSSKVLLQIKNLSISFQQGGKKTQAVYDTSFTLERGRTLALVGGSGSGKSVTALAIVRLLANSTTTGEIRFNNTDLVSLDESKLRDIRGNAITMVFQEPMTSLNPLHHIGKQIGEILQHHGMKSASERQERTIELLSEVGLANAKGRLGSFPHQLSGGQRQRVMIAMALANRPELFIADEPTTALDVMIQAQILHLLKDLQAKHGMALLFITHDLGIVRRIADDVVVMQKGRVVDAGPVNEVFANPTSDYTKMLLAAEPKGSAPPLDLSAPEVLRVENLKVWFPIKRGFLKRTIGHIKAVDGVSITLRAGQTLGVVGESGSGKTTLGLAILRLIRSDGPIVFLGQNIDGATRKQMQPLRAQMQVVFQDPYGSLSPRLSVAEIVEEGLTVQKSALTLYERREIVAQALVDVGLDPMSMDRYPHEFSGGQRQRIAIARAMVLKPQFVVLDEPTSALDMSVQAQIVDLLRDLQKKRRLTYLFISHDLKVVKALSSEILVMKDGKVVERGEASSIFANPQADYTKALFAAAFLGKEPQ